MKGMIKGKVTDGILKDKDIVVHLDESPYKTEVFVDGEPQYNVVKISLEITPEEEPHIRLHTI